MLDPEPDKRPPLLIVVKIKPRGGAVVACQAHNLEVAGSTPAPATNFEGET